MNAEGDPVEDGVVAETAEFVLHVFDDADGVLLRPGGTGFGFLGASGGRKGGEGQEGSCDS